MKQSLYAAMGAMAAVLVSVVLLAGSVSAAGPAPYANFVQTSYYRTWLARAMDECTADTVTVTDPSTGLFLGACPQTNSMTDDSSAKMKYALLTVTRYGHPLNAKVKILGGGFDPLKKVKVQLTLRVTRNFSHVSPLVPGTPVPGYSVTFADVTIQCGNVSGGCFVARSTSAGTLAGSQALKDCLAQNGESTALDSGNIEVLDAALIDCDSGKVMAVPGIIER